MRSIFKLVVCCLLAMSLCDVAVGQQRIGDICRVKGQEENTIHGLGLVVGLKGTGDGGVKPTNRALARMMQQLGGQISSDIRGNLQIEDIENAANVALVMVTATIPAAGSQQGDKLTCYVSAIQAKSLEGGMLMLTPLLGPRSDKPRVFALAQGQITIPDRAIPTAGSVYLGAKMEATVKNEFILDNKVTLVLDSDHASFAMAARIQDEINNYKDRFQSGSSGESPIDLSKAIDQAHIEVKVPPHYVEDAVRFLDQLLDLPLTGVASNNRVVINEREGVVIIGEDVQVAPVAISHKNLTISAGTPIRTFEALDVQSGRQPQPKLKNLVDALNALEVPTEDVIAIIKALKKRGDIYGEVLIQ